MPYYILKDYLLLNLASHLIRTRPQRTRQTYSVLQNYISYIYHIARIIFTVHDSDLF